MPEGNAKYQAYLCSREWSEKKAAVLARSGGVCERCHQHPVDHTHHLTYQNKYKERLEELAGWCKGCHDFTHGKADIDPAYKAPEWNLARLLREEQGDSALLCPVCGFDCSHITRVGTLLGSDEREATVYNGTIIIGTTGYRRSAVAIEVDGECGHRWTIVIQQHKGTNYVSVRSDGNGCHDECERH
jgi:hypothetical protein